MYRGYAASPFCVSPDKDGRNTTPRTQYSQLCAHQSVSPTIVLCNRAYERITLKVRTILSFCSNPCGIPMSLIQYDDYSAG